jgi:predicted flap endonuclease-1-like 5' DNA nuclease
MLFVLLAQTKLTASLEIMVMLVVAALIGYITAKFFYKAECTRSKESFKKQLEKKEKEIKKCHRDNELLEKEIIALRVLQSEMATEGLDLKTELKNINNELAEKDVILTRIAQRKHLLDYTSFGMAEKEDRDDLKIISGIGPFIEERLNALDIYTFGQISKLTAHDIETVTEAIEFFPGRIDRDHWVEQAIKLVEESRSS